MNSRIYINSIFSFNFCELADPSNANRPPCTCTTGKLVNPANDEHIVIRITHLFDHKLIINALCHLCVYEIQQGNQVSYLPHNMPVLLSILLSCYLSTTYIK